MQSFVRFILAIMILLGRPSFRTGRTSLASLPLLLAPRVGLALRHAPLLLAPRARPASRAVRSSRSRPRSCLASRAARASHSTPRIASTSFIGWQQVDEHIFATICLMCFRCTLHIVHQDVVKVDLVLHMFQWLYTYVTIVCFKYFNYFKRMLQVFYLDVAYVVVAYVAVTIHVGCKCMFQIQPFSEICCKCFI
jgi:hypothetical protein